MVGGGSGTDVTAMDWTELLCDTGHQRGSVNKVSLKYKMKTKVSTNQ